MKVNTVGSNLILTLNAGLCAAKDKLIIFCDFVFVNEVKFVVRVSMCNFFVLRFSHRQVNIHFT